MICPPPYGGDTRQIIKELQRHRFGRRAERLPVDQLPRDPLAPELLASPLLLAPPLLQQSRAHASTATPRAPLPAETGRDLCATISTITESPILRIAATT